jgi:Holliday junction resolvase RusA-like endonuclease
MTRIAFTIYGEPASKSNSRKIALLGGRNISVGGEKMRVGGRAAVIKSDKARAYVADFQRQLPSAARLMLSGPIRVTMTIFYASNRSDLDEQLILDCMQPTFDKVAGNRVMTRRGVYENDRQIVERHTFKRIDKANPRTEIEVEPVEAQAQELPLVGEDLDAFCDAGELQ